MDLVVDDYAPAPVANQKTHSVSSTTTMQFENKPDIKQKLDSIQEHQHSSVELGPNDDSIILAQ